MSAIRNNAAKSGQNIRLDRIRCFLLDMDGTVYLGNTLLPGALQFREKLQKTGREWLFITNNSSKSAVHYAAKLAQMGWPAQPEDIMTPGEATCLYLKEQKPGARIFLLGTPELAAEFAAHGFILAKDEPDYVVLGFDMTLEYGKVAAACRFIRAGVPFIATHPDLNCPTEDGFLPDCGSMAAMLTASTGVKPLVIGKPHAYFIQAVRRRKPFPREEVAIVGDRLYTDIATGVNAGITSILVFSGETRPEDLAASAVQPDMAVSGLEELAEML